MLFAFATTILDIRIMPDFKKISYRSFSKNFAYSLIKKLLRKGGTMSKKKETQYKVVSIGKPSIENLTDTEARVFYNSLLSCILQKQINNKKESEEN